MFPLLVGGIAMWIALFFYLMNLQGTHQQKAVYTPNPNPNRICADETPFQPVEAHVVPTHANYSNKFNDVIGNFESGLVGKGIPEVVIPSDWYMSAHLPTDFDGPYWPRGTVEPDFLYPGSDPMRPQRSQYWNYGYPEMITSDTGLKLRQKKFSET
jgi:hypothetical protein